MSGFKITEMYAFVAVDDGDGDEGVMGFMSSNGWLPMVGADLKRVDDLRKVADEAGVPYKIKHFKYDGDL